MKRLIFLLSFFAIAAISFAQEDTVHVTLTAYQHTTIIAYMKEKGQVDKNKYIYTVSPQIDIKMDSTGKNILVNPGKLITYAPTVDFLGSMFLEHGSNQERLVAADNRIIQTSLYQQLQRRPDVLQRLGIIVAANAAQNDEKVQKDGIDYMAKLKE
jgi:hypothetical protein